MSDKHFYKQKKKQNATITNVTRSDKMKHFLHSTMRQRYTKKAFQYFVFTLLLHRNTKQDCEYLTDVNITLSNKNSDVTITQETIYIYATRYSRTINSNNIRTKNLKTQLKLKSKRQLKLKTKTEVCNFRC